MEIFSKLVFIHDLGVFARVMQLGGVIVVGKSHMEVRLPLPEAPDLADAIYHFNAVGHLIYVPIGDVPQQVLDLFASPTGIEQEMLSRVFSELLEQMVQSRRIDHARIMLGTTAQTLDLISELPEGTEEPDENVEELPEPDVESLNVADLTQAVVKKKFKRPRGRKSSKKKPAQKVEEILD